MSSLNETVTKLEECDKKLNTLSSGLENVIFSYKSAEKYNGDLNEEKLLGSEDFRGAISIFGNDKATQSVTGGEVNP